jgi:TonB family protein
MPVDRVLSKKAEFKGGQQEMYKYFGENINYPENSKQDSIEGKIFVYFIIEKDGSISKAHIMEEDHTKAELNTEALRVINSMPNWSPAEAEGKPVATQMTLPIMFKLK